MPSKIKPVPIYTTSGDIEAFLVYPMLFSATGEWVGFVTMDREVYSVHGDYVGWVSDDPRIIRKRSERHDRPRLAPPSPPERLMVPSRTPLAPLMAELTFDMIDVLQDEPERLPTLDAGELRDDMD